VAAAAVNGDLNQGGQVPRATERVISAVGFQDEALAAAEVEEERSGTEAVEADACAVGGYSAFLGAIVATDLDGVEPADVLNEIRVVAGFPDEVVIAGAHKHVIVPGSAVVGLRATAPQQRVIASPAVDRGRLRVREGAVLLIDPDRVVATARVDHDAGELTAVEAEVDGAVVLDIDLQDRRPAGQQAERQHRTRGRADDVQAAVLEVRLVAGAVGAGGLIFTAEATLEGGGIRQVQVGVEVVIEFACLAGGAGREIRAGQTRRQVSEVSGVHVAVAVVVAGDDRRAAVGVDGRTGDRVRTEVHVVADAVTVGVADAGSQRGCARCQAGTYQANQPLVRFHASPLARADGCPVWRRRCCRWKCKVPVSAFLKNARQGLAALSPFGCPSALRRRAAALRGPGRQHPY